MLTHDPKKGTSKPKFTKESKSPPDVKRLKKVVSDSLSSNPLFFEVCLLHWYSKFLLQYMQ